jgi:hypothetical protein
VQALTKKNGIEMENTIDLGLVRFQLYQVDHDTTVQILDPFVPSWTKQLMMQKQDGLTATLLIHNIIIRLYTLRFYD